MADEIEEDWRRLAVTHMDPDVYDALMATIDVPDEAPGLARLAAAARRHRRVEEDDRG